MITQVLHCPYCHETDIVRHGLSPEGKQRYRCRACREGRGRTFLLEYTYAGQSPEVKQQIVDMALNASGIRDTARVLHVSPTTVLKELKRKELNLQAVNQRVLQHLHPEQVEVELWRADEREVRHGLSSERDAMWKSAWTMLQPRGSATLSELESTGNASEGSDGHPRVTLPLLPRDRYCYAWTGA